MLSKQFKFNLRPESEFFDRADRYFSSLFTIFYSKNDHSLEVVVVVPKKAAALATLRNKLKRRVYSALTSLLEKHSDQPFSLVIVAKNELKNADSADLEAELQKACEKIFS